MYCPDCREPMLVLELQDVEIDFCDSCRAIWLDAGELELLLGGSPGVADLLLGDLRPAGKVREARRRCPICSRKMDKTLCGRACQGDEVLVDRCPSGHGFWFDRGELGRVLRLGAADGASRVLDLLNRMFAADQAATSHTKE